MNGGKGRAIDDFDRGNEQRSLVTRPTCLSTRFAPPIITVASHGNRRARRRSAVLSPVTQIYASQQSFPWFTLQDAAYLNLPSFELASLMYPPAPRAELDSANSVYQSHRGKITIRTNKRYRVDFT